MRVLEDIIAEVKVLQSIGSTNVPVVKLTLDSREVEKDWVFVATKGHSVDGHSFIEKAIDSGASAVVCEELPDDTTKATFIQVEDSARALGLLASSFYEHPSNNLILVGITGTNGKTSVASMLYQAFLKFGKATGLLSTIKYSINGKDYQSTHTTPNAVRIQELLAEMVEAGCEYAFMEVSSHALHQQRTAGLDFDGAVFTNITHDHLDYHVDFKDYLYTKKLLFDNLKSGAFALVNKDDKNAKVVTQNSNASRYTFSLKSVSDFKIKVLESDFNGMLVSIAGSEVWLQLVGEFNAYNLLAVYSVCFLLEKEHEEIITVLSALQSVAGRFQNIKEAGITAIVDYAHTPDALQNVLNTINAIRSKNEQLITVVGCGGDRDREKRPIMGGIAAANSSRTILTSDNPRSEDPEQIIQEMSAGVAAQDFKKVLKITNREEAIKTAISFCNPGDVILVAGKGHETYQEIKGVKHPFDDKEILIKNLKLIQS